MTSERRMRGDRGSAHTYTPDLMRSSLFNMVQMKPSSSSVVVE